MATSTVLLGLQVVLALPHLGSISPTMIAAIIAAILELATVTLLLWVFVSAVWRSSERRVTALCFGCGTGLCVVAAALTVATLICLSIGKTLGTYTSAFLAGTAIALVLSFALQLLFLVSRFIADRAQQQNEHPSTPSMLEVGRRSPTTRVKTVPYSRVSPPPGSHASSRAASMDASYPPASSGGFSARSTIYSMASSVENVVRSASSKTRLISSNHSLRSQRSGRSARRAASLESVHQPRATSSAAGDVDSFDSWDTSAVDPQNRQLVIETSATSPGIGRFLETIPASPTTSRSPSPGTPLDQFELPSPRLDHSRRSRSFSPATSARSLVAPQPPRRAFTTQHASASESHIHPLFRSDSPTPPPMASPGTVVIAAPRAGQVISDRLSIRSLSRMRSGSLPAVSSPLTSNESFESLRFARGGVGGRGGGGGRGDEGNDKTFSASSEDSLRSDEQLGEVPEEVPERKITPPVPEYILNAAGSHSQPSLHALYPARKTPSRDGPRGPGLSALQGAAW